jgi:hypothetical protein
MSKNNYIVYFVYSKNDYSDRFFNFCKLKDGDSSRETTMLYDLLNEIKRKYNDYKNEKRVSKIYQEMFSHLGEAIENNRIFIRFFIKEEVYSFLCENENIGMIKRLCDNNPRLEYGMTTYGFVDNKVQIASRHKFNNFTISEMRSKFNLVISKEKCLNIDKQKINNSNEKVNCKFCNKSLLSKNMNRHLEIKHSS